MSAIGTITLTFARSGMELSWRYAWVLYLIQVAGGRRLPLIGAVCVFLTAAVVTRLMAGRNWRLYQRMLLKTGCFIPAALLVVHQVLYETFPLFSLNWINHLLQDAGSIQQWIILLMTLFCVLLIWQGGQVLVKSSRLYYPLCIRFDKGMGLLFLLLITIAFIESRVGFHPPGRDYIYLAIAYMMFGLTAMSVARNESSVQKSFLAGRHGIGVILSTTILITLLTTGTILFFYPYISGVSNSLSAFMKGAAEPIDSVLFNTFLFVLRSSERSPQSVESDAASQKLANSDNSLKSTDMDGMPLEDGGGLFQVIMGWSFLTIIGIICIGAGTCLLVYIVRLLFKKTRDDTAQPLRAGWIVDILSKLVTLPLLLWDSLAALLKRADCAARVFAQMIRWGSSCGINKRHNETPSEYGSKLVRVFPNLMVEIQQIVDGFNREIYGQTPTNQESLSRLQLAFRRMKHIRHWPERIKVWFIK